MPSDCSTGVVGGRVSVVNHTGDDSYFDDRGSVHDLLANGIKAMNVAEAAEWPEVFLGVKQRKFYVGDEGDPSAPLLLVTLFAPLAVLPRHSHRETFMDAVVQGSIHIGEGDEWSPAGTVRWFPAGATYGPTHAGPEGCILLEFYRNDGGFTTTVDEDTLTDEMKTEIARIRSNSGQSA